MVEERGGEKEKEERGKERRKREEERKEGKEGKEERREGGSRSGGGNTLQFVKYINFLTVLISLSLESPLKSVYHRAYFIKKITLSICLY